MIGIGGSTIEAELAAIQPTAHLVKPIGDDEFKKRMQRATELMKTENVTVIYLHAGTNLFYFTGMRWNSSERMVGALLFSDGTLQYIAPKFEEGTILDFMRIKGEVKCWEEHESPYALFSELLASKGIVEGNISIDEATPFFVSNGIQLANANLNLVDAKPITGGCRMIKSDAEIAIMQHAMNITLEVQKAAARILRPGISAQEVTNFINEAHKRYGASAGSYFCIVLFGVDSSFPHGVKTPKNLEEGEVVLIDTGCLIHDYISDITRTYVYGTPTEEQTRIWNIEKETQLAAFEAAQLGATCGAVDDASRKVLAAHGLSGDYELPGLPHRTGHGIGLDIHEWPYIVRNNTEVLKEGMCFSNEPMICVPNKFGIRHEDHIYMTKEGPKWFTQPMHSIDNPFGIKE